MHCVLYMYMHALQIGAAFAQTNVSLWCVNMKVRYMYTNMYTLWLLLFAGTNFSIFKGTVSQYKQ